MVLSARRLARLARVGERPLAYLTGDFEKVRPAAQRLLQQLERYVTEPDRFASPTLCRRLAESSAELGRMVAVLVDRRGHTRHILLGDAKRIWMPDLGRIGGGPGRTRGLRLIVAQPPSQSPLTLPADLRTDLTRLRLDALALIEARRDGAPGAVILALPSFEEDGSVHCSERRDPSSAHLFERNLSAELERIDQFYDSAFLFAKDGAYHTYLSLFRGLLVTSSCVVIGDVHDHKGMQFYRYRCSSTHIYIYLLFI